MLRIVLGVVAGYAAMIVLVFLMVFGFLALWPEHFSAGKPYRGPEFILYVELALTLAFAVVGGLVATTVGGRRAAWALIAIMVVFGTATFFMEQGLKPTWSIAGTVIAGPIGAFIGSRLRKDRPRA